MNCTKRPRARAARLLGGLAALALALLAPRAAASVPRAGDLPVPVHSFSASAIESPIGVTTLSVGLDLSALERALIPDADVVEAPRFSLGDVVLEETEREQRFGLGPMQLVDVEAVRGPPESYPETRIRAFAFLGSTLIGVSRGVSLELQPGYERIGLGLAEGDVVNLYAYVGLQPHAAVDPMGESLMGDLLHIGKRAAPKVATAFATGLLLSAAGPFGVVIGAGILLNTGIAIYGEVGGSDDPVAELLDLGQDVTGIRSAMEGMTGKEAGTGRALSREERLDAIGDAIGDGAAVLAGKAGARLGAGARRMAAAGRGRTGRREASATGRRAGAESREGHARGGTRDHGAQATSRPTRSAGAAADDAVSAARKMDDGIGCPFRSFSPDTLVATASGLIPIDQVAPGTEVWAADEETGERSLRKVSSTAFHLAEDGLLLTVDGETLQTTAQHPFFTAGGEWVEAAKLQVGQEVRSLGGELLRVEKVEKRDGRFAVFNFKVDEDHSYFVGDAGLLVHNAGPCGPRGSRGALGPNRLKGRAVDAPTSGEGGAYQYGIGGKVKTGSTGDFGTRYPDTRIEREFPQTRLGPATDDAGYQWSPRRQRRFDEEFLDRTVPPKQRYRSPRHPVRPVTQKKWDDHRDIFGYGGVPSDFGY